MHAPFTLNARGAGGILLAVSDVERKQHRMIEKTFEKIVSHAKNTGFVFPGSEIYGGLSNAWDFGPYGVLLKDHIKQAWQKKFIQEDPNNVEIQAAILMNPRVWQASGHLKSFADPMMDLSLIHI